jgi:co-chaperonin GroES (HSP10)
MSIAKVKGKIIPLHDNVIVTDMNFDEQRTSSGIIIRSDDGKSEGVKPRWCRVWAVGPEQKDVKVGDWILVEHGRWTRGVTYEDNNGEEIVIRRVEVKSIMMSSDEKPNDLELGTYSSTQQGQTFTPDMFISR